MYSKLYSFLLIGIDCHTVTVEVDSMNSMPSFDLVGLPDNAVKEARDRVRYAIRNSGFVFPTTRLTVNLAPAEMKKSGSMYDLAILLGVLKSSGQLDVDTDKFAFVGQMSLSGDILPVAGVLPMVLYAKEQGFESVFVPFENAYEGSMINGINVYGIKNIKQLISHLNGEEPLTPVEKISFEAETLKEEYLDFEDVKGQPTAKYALEVAAAGGHNLLMIGPPGSGKSMLAKRLPSILPNLSFEEAIETTKVYSISGELNSSRPFVTRRPFRSPHHNVSPAGLAGGGANPRPGEISLAHNGVLFLDELPEFTRSAMEILRQPLEDGKICISRVAGNAVFPANVTFIAAMNPCPCGYKNHPTRECTCGAGASKRYLSRISGPLLDRIDIHVEMLPVKYEEMTSTKKGESSAEIKQRVEKARQMQRNRFKGTKINCNADIPAALIPQMCQLTDEAKELLKKVFDRLCLSARAYDKILKLSRTIADLSGEEIINDKHVGTAVRFRSLDRKYWGEG